MPQFTVEPEALTSAGHAAKDAAALAKGKDGQAAMSTAGGAMPGAASVSYLSNTGTMWSDDVESWSRNVSSYGDSLIDQAEDYRNADRAAKEMADRLRHLLGMPS